jgi:hypothetical protein
MFWEKMQFSQVISFFQQGEVSFLDLLTGPMGNEVIKCLTISTTPTDMLHG